MHTILNNFVFFFLFVITGIYSCVAENKFSKTTAEANIRVHKTATRPILEDAPYDIETVSGNSIEIPCKAKGETNYKVSYIIFGYISKILVLFMAC